eukprot:scaffold8088_cov189-Alexandrium_tamarense.AAC.12
MHAPRLIFPVAEGRLMPASLWVGGGFKFLEATSDRQTARRTPCCPRALRSRRQRANVTKGASADHIDTLASLRGGRW